jgi:prophage tail gpP-like protein
MSEHDYVVSVVVNGAEIGGWISGNIESSILTPADSFVLRRPFDLQAWNLLRRDSRVTVRIDGTTILDGFIDKRIRHAKAGTMEISGRDRAGRLVDESAPEVDYSGLTILAAARKLAAPWFKEVVISNAANRLLRRGKGRRVAAGNEPVVTITLRMPRRGKVHPGQSRWQIIHEIAERAGLIAFSSSDGKSLFIGKPNMSQAPQYIFAHAKAGSSTRTTVKDLTVTEDDGDRYSLIMVCGTGGQGDTNYGDGVVDARGIVFDNPFNKIDGSGRDFIRPKRMAMPEKMFDNYGDAQRVAEREQLRRDYKRHVVSVECAGFGQFLDGLPTLFSPDTIARVIDEELELDDTYLVVSCSYSFSREEGDHTTMHMVPTGTELVL